MGPGMPKQRANEGLSAADRRSEVALILAKGIVRWRRCAKAPGITNAQESSPGRETRLELSPEPRLSVSDGTRGLWPRADGDEA